MYMAFSDKTTESREYFRKRCDFFTDNQEVMGLSGSLSVSLV